MHPSLLLYQDTVLGLLWLMSRELDKAMEGLRCLHQGMTSMTQGLVL